MAEIKKYLDVQALGTLVDKIKEEDAKVLDSAKAYADGLASNYDAAGAAKTVQDNLDLEIARAQAAEKVNADAIAGIKDGANLDSFADVEAEIAKYQLAGDYATKAEAQGYADAKDEAIAAAQKAGDDAQVALDNFKVAVGETYETKTDAAAKLTEAKGYVDAEIAKVDAKIAESAGDIEDLAGRVDTLEANGYDDTEVRGLIKANADAIDLVEADVETIKNDYLKAADKTELADAIVAEKERAEGVEGGLDTRIKAIEDDYLKAADKEALQNQINTILNNPDTEGVINSINEFTQYIEEHGEVAEGFRADIDQNKADIEAVEGALSEHEEFAAETYATKVELANEKKALQDEIDADVAVVDGRVATLEGVVNGKADKTYVDGQVEALQGVDAGLANRIAVLEAKHGDGEGTVESLIAAAKAEAIEEAGVNASNQDAVVLAESQKYVDAEIDKVELAIDTLQDVVNGKAAQSEVDTISGKVTTLEGKVGTLETEMDAVEALAAAADAAAKANAQAIALKASQADLEAAVDRIAANEGAISTLNGVVADKAEQDDLDAAVARIAANETAIAANTSAINSFTPITSDRKSVV